MWILTFADGLGVLCFYKDGEDDEPVVAEWAQNYLKCQAYRLGTVVTIVCENKEVMTQSEFLGLHDHVQLLVVPSLGMDKVGLNTFVLNHATSGRSVYFSLTDIARFLDVRRHTRSDKSAAFLV